MRNWGARMMPDRVRMWVCRLDILEFGLEERNDYTNRVKRYAVRMKIVWGRMGAACLKNGTEESYLDGIDGRQFFLVFIFLGMKETNGKYESWTLLILAFAARRIQ